MTEEMTQLTYLKDEINKGLTIHDFEPLIRNWYSELDPEIQDELIALEFDPDNYDFLTEKKFQQYYKSLENYGYHNLHLLNDYDFQSPAVTKSNAEILKKAWLIHFSESDYDICYDGFKVGLPLEQKEGKLSHFKNRKDYGWNFAYFHADLHEFDVRKRMRNYGEQINVFQANCVRFHHDADMEYQVMFLGQYVKRTYCIYDYDGQFYIKKDTKKDSVEVEFDSFREAVNFIINYKYRYKIWGYKR